jgi:hypothetical protein
MYYKPIMIVNDDSSIVNKLETSLIDDARVVIYNCHMFIEQAPLMWAGKLDRFAKVQISKNVGFLSWELNFFCGVIQ